MRSQASSSSWHDLWVTIPLAIAALFFARAAFHAHDVAKREQIGQATIANCERSGKGGYSCYYVFSVGNGDFKGSDKSSDYFGYGQSIDVYYDSQQPTRNAIHSFSKKTRDDWGWSVLLLTGMVGIFAKVLYVNRTIS